MLVRADQIDTAMIFARADFVNVHQFLGLRGDRLTITTAAAAMMMVCKTSCFRSTWLGAIKNGPWA